MSLCALPLRLKGFSVLLEIVFTRKISFTILLWQSCKLLNFFGRKIIVCFWFIIVLKLKLSLLLSALRWKLLYWKLEDKNYIYKVLWIRQIEKMVILPHTIELSSENLCIYWLKHGEFKNLGCLWISDNPTCVTL